MEQIGSLVFGIFICREKCVEYTHFNRWNLQHILSFSAPRRVRQNASWNFLFYTSYPALSFETQSIDLLWFAWSICHYSSGQDVWNSEFTWGSSSAICLLRPFWIRKHLPFDSLFNRFTIVKWSDVCGAFWTFNHYSIFLRYLIRCMLQILIVDRPCMVVDQLGRWFGTDTIISVVLKIYFHMSFHNFSRMIGK